VRFGFEAHALASGGVTDAPVLVQQLLGQIVSDLVEVCFEVLPPIERSPDERRRLIRADVRLGPGSEQRFCLVGVEPGGS
jgi:hypothetical protein